MHLSLLSDSIHEGFVFVPKAIGGRYVDVRLVQDLAELQRQKVAAVHDNRKLPIADQLELRFGFAIPLPDGIFDYEKLDAEKTYADRELPDLSREELQARIEARPCCATDNDSTGDGDPVNIVIVAKSGDVLNSRSRAASKEQPAVNLAKDPYFSDGLRLVLMLSADPVPYPQVESLLWDEVVAPTAEGQSSAAERVHSDR
ncbi:hypothetical protein [Congregibacter sp.]|uniref:hypothetical protein n=1 Tax=Congregibacter sp. TaxID=2744308 RepID=UPI003F6C3F62